MNNKFFNIGSKVKNLGALIVLFVMLMVLSIVSPVFLTVSNIRNVIVQVAVIAVIAEGTTFVCLTGGIDLSVGAVLGVAGVLAAGVMRNTGNTTLAVLTCLGVAVLFGICSGVLIAYGNVAPFVSTLGLMSIARGIAFIYTHGKPISNFPDSFRFMGAGDIGGVPVMIYIVIVSYAIMYIVQQKTPFGRITYAIGSNEEATRLTGIDTKKYKVIIYTVAGFLTGIASLMYVGRINSGHPNSGTGYELDAIAAVVIGGTSLSGGKGSVLGTIVGALIMGVIKNGLNLLNVDTYYQNVVIGTVIILAVLFDRNSKNTNK
ncbi:MAG: ABC transporter permease [Treponema sp.]